MAEKIASKDFLTLSELEETRTQRSRSVTAIISAQSKPASNNEDKVHRSKSTVGPPAPFEGRERAQSIANDGEMYPAHWQKRIPTIKPHKSSSTSTLFIDSTITQPKNGELMRCMAEYVHSKIQPLPKTPPEQTGENFDIFDERANPLFHNSADKQDTRAIPAINTIEKFIKDVFKIGQLAPESLIMSIAYINRCFDSKGFIFYPYNWRRMLLASLILASKVWEDQAVWLIDFIDLLPASNPHDLAMLEKKMLALLKFDVSLKASEYGKIYFDIRAQSNSTTQQFKDLKPLNKEGVERLELRSTAYPEKHNLLPRPLPRMNSFDNLKDVLKSPRAVLS